VLANGDVTICGVASDEPELVAGNVLDRPFREIWANAALFARTRALDVHDLGGICGRCAFREFCGGACRLSAFRESGDFLAPYELCQRFYDEGLIADELLDPEPQRQAVVAARPSEWWGSMPTPVQLGPTRRAHASA
jgi:radical SAM protein with 4Fe4S-binding SPASM domain